VAHLSQVFTLRLGKTLLKRLGTAARFASKTPAAFARDAITDAIILAERRRAGAILDTVADARKSEAAFQNGEDE